MITQAQLKARLTYDPVTGLFARPDGSVVSTTTENGYVVVRLFDRLYRAHRLAWLYVHGCFPPNDTDHVNGVRSDNRIANLRLATRSQNLQNKRGRSTSGFKGVVTHSDVRRTNRYGAQIWHGGKNVWLGWHLTAEEAGAAYAAAAKQLFGEFACVQIKRKAA